MAHLQIDGVSKSFGVFRAVDNVSIGVRDGEFLAMDELRFTPANVK